MQAHESCSAYTAFACVCVRDGSKDVGEDEMRSRSGQSAMIYTHQHTCTYTHTYTHTQSVSCSLSPFLTNIHTSPLAAATFPLSCTHSSFPHRRCRPVMSAQACQTRIKLTTACTSIVQHIPPDLLLTVCDHPGGSGLGGAI